MWRAKLRPVILVPGTKTQNIHLELNECCPHFHCNLHALRNTILESHFKYVLLSSYGEHVFCFFVGYLVCDLPSQQSSCIRIKVRSELISQLCCTHWSYE